LAVRLRYAIPFVLLLAAIYLLSIRPWMTNWGSTAAERQMPLFGDELIPEGSARSTQGITIDAPAEVVWQWLVQSRAGPRWLLHVHPGFGEPVGADIHNANEIHPEWQALAAGDMWRVVPPDYLGEVGKDAGFRVLRIEPGQALVVEVMGAYVLVPVDKNTTQLLVRGAALPSDPLMAMVVQPIVFTMARPMLLGLKARAEGHPEAPAAFMAISSLAGSRRDTVAACF
jgi:hypothetical protein